MPMICLRARVAMLSLKLDFNCTCVEEVLVVVDRGIVHCLDRTLGISGRLPVVAHLGSSYRRAGAIGKTYSRADFP